MYEGMKVCIIAARSEDNVIGKNGGIPWSIPGEQTFFKMKTMGHVIIMGRKTYDFIGHPLKGRKTIVVTGNGSFAPDMTGFGPGTVVMRAKDVEEAFNIASTMGDDIIYVAGGAQIYEQTISCADRLYLTTVHKKIELDGTEVFFPVFDESDYEVQSDEDRKDFTRFVFTRKSSVHLFRPGRIAQWEEGRSQGRQCWRASLPAGMGTVCVTKITDPTGRSWHNMYFKIAPDGLNPGMNFLKKGCMADTDDVLRDADLMLFEFLINRRNKCMDTINAIDEALQKCRLEKYYTLQH